MRGVPPESRLVCKALAGHDLAWHGGRAFLPVDSVERLALGLKIAIIVHPRGLPDRVEMLRDVVSRLRRAGHRVTPRLTFESGDATIFARSAARSRYDLIVAAGGDGTLNEVINGIVRSRWQPRLGIVPMGTANDFAAGLAIPEDPWEALQVAIHGRPIAVDVARANRRSFINVSTGGFGARATEATSIETKRLFGSLAYLITGVKEFVELRPIRARFMADDRLIFSGEFLLFAVGNAKQTGGGSLITPRAEFDDGLLDILVVPALPRLEFLSLLPELRAGNHLASPGVVYTQASTLTVSASGPLNVNADGEPLHARRLRYSLHPRPLSVMIP